MYTLCFSVHIQENLEDEIVKEALKTVKNEFSKKKQH